MEEMKKKANSVSVAATQLGAPNSSYINSKGTTVNTYNNPFGDTTNGSPIVIGSPSKGTTNVINQKNISKGTLVKIGGDNIVPSKTD